MWCPAANALTLALLTRASPWPGEREGAVRPYMGWSMTWAARSAQICPTLPTRTAYLTQTLPTNSQFIPRANTSNATSACSRVETMPTPLRTLSRQDQDRGSSVAHLQGAGWRDSGLVSGIISPTVCKNRQFGLSLSILLHYRRHRAAATDLVCAYLRRGLACNWNKGSHYKAFPNKSDLLPRIFSNPSKKNLLVIEVVCGY